MYVHTHTHIIHVARSGIVNRGFFMMFDRKKNQSLRRTVLYMYIIIFREVSFRGPL